MKNLLFLLLFSMGLALGSHASAPPDVVDVQYSQSDRFDVGKMASQSEKFQKGFEDVLHVKYSQSDHFDVGKMDFQSKKIQTGFEELENAYRYDFQDGYFIDQLARIKDQGNLNHESKSNLKLITSDEKDSSFLNVPIDPGWCRLARI